MTRLLRRSLLIALILVACTPDAAEPNPTETQSPPPATSTATSTLEPTDTPAPTATITPSPLPVVERLKARVTVDGFLSCRYGPGPEYLYLYALRTGANIILIGRTDGENWNWVYVEGQNQCWVHAGFIEIFGDRLSLPIVYPGIAKLPVSPYYQPTTVLSARRKHDLVEVSWLDIPLRAGDEEDERMQHYVVEAWRCESGQILFEPLATNDTSITFIDEAGCNQPSHGRIFVQEKHGFAGPTEIPWPAHYP